MCKANNEIIIKMAEAGIACNVHYKPLPMHTAYKNMGFDIADYPNAYAYFAVVLRIVSAANFLQLASLWATQFSAAATNPTL